MNRYIQALIALTCVVILALGGYWFWEKQTQRRSAADEATAIRTRQDCIAQGKRFIANIKDHAGADACLQAGILTPSDMTALMQGKDITN